MDLNEYSFEIENAVKTIKEQGYRTVAVQLPEGLKRSVFPLVSYLEKETQARILVVADPCFGACDMVNYELKNLDVDCVLHIGHTPIPDVENFWIPTLFVNALSKQDVTSVVKKAIPSLKGKRIGIVTTAQHLQMLDTAADILKQHNLEPFISEGDGRTSAKGQILGCNFSAGLNIKDKVDSFLFIGSGMFHPIGLLLGTKKLVVAADPYTNTVKKQELDELKDVILRQRYGAISAAKSSKSYGILIGTKRGQQRLKIAYKIKETLDGLGKKSVLIAMDHFSPVSLQGFGDIDCFISTACPRIAIDDYVQYKKPIITAVELDIMLGKLVWDEYVFDQILNDEYEVKNEDIAPKLSTP